MKHILICQHGGSRNHGCEALARTVIDSIARLPERYQVTLYSYDVAQDRHYLADLSEVNLTGLNGLPGRFSPYNLGYHAKRVLGKPASKLPLGDDFMALVARSELVIAIGGDNYCYNMGQGYYMLDRMVKRAGKKYMLLGASIEPDDLQKGLAAHLGIFDRVTVRESISYAAMQRAGMDNIRYVPDSAFLLERCDDAPLPQGLDLSRAVGINLSPLLIQNEQSANLAIENFVTLIDWILRNTDLQIALVPHVVWNDNDDRKALAQLRARFPGEGRIFTIDDAPARTLKGVIGRLRLFVGARTHSTIAAYSSGVPTLALGYSVKARGIAQDLFGTVDGYVVPVQQLRTRTQVCEAFCALLAREDEVRAHLAQVLPDYRAKARTITDEIAAVLEAPPQKRCRAAFAAAAKAHDVLQKTSSGGVFALLAERVIGEGGVVFGAALDANLQLRHRAARTMQELVPLLGSKYLQSALGDTIEQAQHALAQGQSVLFCGTGCQTAQARKALGEHPKLVLCDVVCHGTVPQALFDQYVAEVALTHGAAVQHVSFKDKRAGWQTPTFVITLADGREIATPSGQDPYMQLYLQNLTLRSACYQCRCKGKGAHSDLTLGDFWGIRHFVPDFDYQAGASLVLAHTEVGERAYAAIAAHLHSVAVDPIGTEQYNPCLVRPSIAHPAVQTCLQQLRGETFAQVAARYRVKPSAKQRIISLLRR